MILHPIYRTKAGKVLTDDEIEAFADEAEVGYDVHELCWCIYPDVPPGSDTCECGHVLDEHDESGQCQVELDRA